MSIVSRKMKGGRAYAQYGCSARHHKGASVCENGQTIGEARLTNAVVGALRSYFASPDYERWIADAYDANQRARARAARRDDEMASLEGEVRAAEARIEKVTEALARIGYSEPLAAKLRAEEAKLLNAREALAVAAPSATVATPPPSHSRAAVLAVVDNLASAVLAKPQKGKALLRAVVEGILMEPSPDGYAVRVTLKKTNPAALDEGGGVGDSQRSCGGAISTMEQTVVVIELSSEISLVRGVSSAETLVRVREPRVGRAVE